MPVLFGGISIEFRKDNMNKKHLYSSFLATSAMTALGYIYSWVTGNKLKEPKILGLLLNRLFLKKHRVVSRLSGWAVHYAVGLLFTEMYAAFWHPAPENKIKSGLVFGSIGGLAAILIWRFTLACHPRPPRIRFNRFAVNLFVGHILFGIVSALTLPTGQKKLFIMV